MWAQSREKGAVRRPLGSALTAEIVFVSSRYTYSPIYGWGCVCVWYDVRSDRYKNNLSVKTHICSVRVPVQYIVEKEEIGSIMSKLKPFRK